MEVEGKPLICSTPKRGSVDTSCVVHHRSLVSKYGWWQNRDDAGYAHDWEFVRPWVENQEPWVATELATVIYGVETCGQKEFILQKAGVV